MPSYITVETHDELLNLINPTKDMVVYCKEDSKIYVYQEETGWNLMQSNSEGGVGVSLYELNKQVISQLPPLEKGNMDQVIDMLNEWRPSNLCMLYGQEISYFTILKQQDGQVDFENFGKGIIELIFDITDTIYSIERVNEDTAIEIWIKYKDMVTVLYLFDYSTGLVTFNG